MPRRADRWGALRSVSKSDASGAAYLLGCPVGRYRLETVERERYQFAANYGILWQPGNVWYFPRRTYTRGLTIHLEAKPAA